MSRRSRAALLQEMSGTMQTFMARAVLYQAAVAKSIGLNASDLQCIGLLMSQGPATAGELAERTGLTAGGAVTGMIDRLERAGLVQRSRDETDRRRVVVTANAELLRERVGPVYTRVAKRWTDYLSALDDDQIAFANELFSMAAEINLEETRQLQQSPSR